MGIHLGSLVDLCFHCRFHRENPTATVPVADHIKIGSVLSNMTRERDSDDGHVPQERTPTALAGRS